MSKNIFFDDRNVLLVEDELAVAEKVSGHLSALGFAEVLIATSLAQAHSILERSQVDAAVLDVNLRGNEMTVELGWSMVADNIPVVFFSGFNADEMARLTRGHEFMEKPISVPRLKASLQRAMLRVPSQAQNFERKKMAGQTARQ